MKIPKIGLKIYNIYQDIENWKKFDTFELISSDRGFLFNRKKIAKAKKFLRGKNLSMHTQTTRIFGSKKFKIKDFEESELMVLKSEIILCKILGCKEFIFHLKPEKLTKKEEKSLKELLNFAKKNKVEMLYENSGHKYKNFLDILKKFPRLKCVLDLGHLNFAIGHKEIGIPLEKFINKIKDRIIYIHAHNNNGIIDEHKAINDGTLDWKYVLDMLNISRIRKIIIGCKTPRDIKKTKKALEKYLEQRK